MHADGAGKGHTGDQPERTADDHGNEQRPGPGFEAVQRDAAVDEAEEEERHLRRIAEDAFELVEGVAGALGCVHEEARVAARVDSARLSAAFTAVVLAVAAWTAASAVPALT